MASIERTAYPRFPSVLANSDIQSRFTPSPDEIKWVAGLTRGQDTQLCALVLLKCFEQLHYFPDPESIPAAIIQHIAAVRGFEPATTISYKSTQTLYRHHAAIRRFLGVNPFEGKEARKLAIRIARDAAQTVDMRTDIINATIDELITQQYELPAFSTLDKIAEQVHVTVQENLFKRVAKKLSEEERQLLDNLVTKEWGGKANSVQPA